ncbi:MAG: sulfotransferase domain-containing protein [Pseudolabrys sp.]|nr:sulfotransferase domain-containing protein [Pseudolabrys sp.]
MKPAPLVANGIPKSGTYFLDAIVNATGLWQSTGLHLAAPHTVVRSSDGSTSTDSRPATSVIPALADGTYANAHMIWSSEIEAAILSRNAKHVLIIRDPRDTIVSMMRWQTYNPKFVTNAAEQEAQSVLRLGFADDRARALHFIHRMRWNDYAQYAPWLKSSACHVVRFEELYSELTDDKSELTSVKGLLNYLSVGGIDSASLRATLHQGVTSSGIKNKIGAWRELFGEEHMSLLDYPALNESMAALGYTAHSHPALTKVEFYDDANGKKMRREYWNPQHPECPSRYRVHVDQSVYVRAEPAEAAVSNP